MIISILNNEEYIRIDESFQAHYGDFKDDAKYLYVKSFWGHIKHWKAHPFINSEISFVQDGIKSNITFACFEHVSVCIDGSADFVMYNDNNDQNTCVSHWTFGSHNVDNGWGYLTTNKLLNTNFNNFKTCCIIQDDAGRDLNLPYTKFEILSGDQSINTNKPYKWIHVAHGNVQVNNVSFEQKQTIFNVAINTELITSGNNICIGAYSE